MSNYTISKLYKNDSYASRQVDQLLFEEGIRKDANLDYTCCMYDDDLNIIATGSLFGNTLRCMAVSHAHQGEGLMNEIVTHLIEVQFERENTHLFLYTKCSTAKFFGNLGFYEIANISGQLVFMENQKNGFQTYCRHLVEESSKLNLLTKTKTVPRIAAIVMNANPFTNGHLSLIEKAASENDILHLFMVSEDASLIPYAIRKQLILDATAQFSNICYHDSGPYIISNSTFPSYFQKDEASVIQGHALLDLTIFKSIANALHITKRYVGEEPTSQVTGIYNDIMICELPRAGIDCIVVPRKEANGKPISASTVRKAIHDGAIDSIKPLVPDTTYQFFKSPAAQKLIQKIQSAEEVIHY